ncbi:exonuclease [Sporosarcina sp. P12(2017)]|uniref:AAA family ATPase n=1 Tax=unclassified Sporosarcina TaxID=2647733 RepID=UPI000C16895A|nr:MULTISPECIES: SMC family ATPase [unclassified Sporosarcina]PIC58655.1 exonuclease [Sporosarcina sp. P10]PIC61974.1 exonuclease [Sporosarcina sp. P12(2017)]
MKPITLTMTAFGPYKEKETVDFRDLKDHRLFVISGKTGAGKTTIFDGICFALYGQASGEDRTDTKALRSQFADDDIQTTVELTFDIHKRRYRVVRQIPYRKKGNKSDTLGRCELFEEKDEQFIPAVDRQIVTEVNDKIEQLLGFTHAQFSQIMMLPQGEFRKFLTSDTANKEAIMRKIFKTEPYQKIVERLKVKKEEANAEYLREKQLSEAILHQIPAKLPARASLLFTELQSDYPNYHQLVSGLQQEHAHHVTQSKEAHKEYTRLYTVHNEKQQTLHDARSINEQFTKLLQRQKELDGMLAKQQEMKSLEQKLQQAERAARLEDLEQQVKSNVTECQKKERSHSEAVKLLAETEEKLVSAKASYEQELAKESERNEVKEQLLTLNNLLPTVSGLATQRQVVESLKHTVDQAENSLLVNQQASKKQKESIAVLKSEIKELETSLEKYEELLDQLAQSKAIAKQVASYKQQLSQRQEVEAHYETAKQQVEHSAEVYQALENRWISNQAVVLAASLHEGESCPVCGSIDHPAKAEGSETEHVSKRQIDTAKLELTNKEQTFHTKQAELQQVMQRIEQSEAELHDQRVDLNRDYHKEQAELTDNVAELRSKREVLKQKKDEQNQAEKAMEDLAEKINTLEQQRNESKGELETKLALYNHVLTTVPENLQELSALQQQITSKETASQKLEHDWKSVQQKLQDATTEKVKWESRAMLEKQSLTDMQEKLDRSEASFAKRMIEEGFASKENYMQVKLPTSTRQAIEQQLQVFTQTLHTLKSSVEELQRSVEGKQPSDIEIMEQQVEALKTQYEEAFAHYNQSKAWEQAAQDLHNELETSKSREAELEKTYGKITNLYDIVRGQNHLKISFERYIQIEYLERIIYAANIRLRDLSNGQYELVRSDRQETRGKQSGLGIDVHDAYTGQTRDVKTLSGGEKFNASLCLALGMADVIQSFQGAVRMETMFIDEGFGALDEEAIQKAIDTLIALQQSGRMIGIISHIDEMKEAIPATLQVTKLKEGYSKTKFVLS